MVFEPTDATGRFYELRVVYRSELWRSPRLESAFYTRHLKNFKFADLGKYVRLGLSPRGKFDNAGNEVHLKTSLVDGDRMHIVLYVASAANRTVDQVEIEMTRYVPTDLELAEQRLMARMEQRMQQMGGEKYDMPKLGPGDQYIVYKVARYSPSPIYHNFFLFEDYKAVLGTNLELETIEFNDFLRKEIYNYYQQNKIWWTDFINEFINLYSEIWEDSNIRKVINERSLGLNSNYDFINIISKMCQINTYEDFLSINPRWSEKLGEHTRIDSQYFPFDMNGSHLLLSYLASKIHILDIYYQAYGNGINLFILRSTRLMPNNKKFLFYYNHSHERYPLVNMPNYSFRKSVNIDGLYEIIDN